MEFKNQVIAMANFAAQKGWTPATAGNFSVRADKGIAITASGFDKSALRAENILRVALNGEIEGNLKPSAETPLHLALYRYSHEIHAVAHTHSLPVTALSQLATGNTISFSNYELAKVFPGIETHEHDIQLPIYDNSQDIAKLAEEVIGNLRPDSVPAVVIKGHGIYVWGESSLHATRYLEAIEFMFACELAKRSLPR
jgi:methylthioribulose-1-phosphate dehydratase